MHTLFSYGCHTAPLKIFSAKPSAGFGLCLRAALTCWAFYSSYAVPAFGEINTLWSALLFVAAGGILALFFNKDKFTPIQKQDQPKWKELSKAFTIMFENPKVGIGGVVKTINAIGQFGFAIFLPTYLARYGYSVSEWLQIWGTLFFVNIVFNIIFGAVGDKLGWRNTVMWFGGVGCGIFTLALYYTPQLIGHQYWVLMIIACCYGAALAGYVPLSALLPTLAPDNKGAAMSVLNLGSGLCAFIAPGIVSLFIVAARCRRRDLDLCGIVFFQCLSDAILDNF